MAQAVSRDRVAATDRHASGGGWLGVLFPESVGGFGGSFLDSALVIEQLGKTLVPEPYLPSIIRAGRAILLAGND